jgi:hypothetical protein
MILTWFFQGHSDMDILLSPDDPKPELLQFEQCQSSTPVRSLVGTRGNYIVRPRYCQLYRNRCVEPVQITYHNVTCKS